MRPIQGSRIAERSKAEVAEWLAVVVKLAEAGFEGLPVNGNRQQPLIAKLLLKNYSVVKVAGELPGHLGAGRGSNFARLSKGEFQPTQQRAAGR